MTKVLDYQSSNTSKIYFEIRFDEVFTDSEPIPIRDIRELENTSNVKDRMTISVKGCKIYYDEKYIHIDMNPATIDSLWPDLKQYLDTKWNTLSVIQYSSDGRIISQEIFYVGDETICDGWSYSIR